MGWRKLAVATGLSMLGALPAHADIWHVNGASCTPGDPAIQANRYLVTAGSVNYRSGASGLVTLYCTVNPAPVMVLGDYETKAQPWCPLRYSFRLTYTDSDGAGSAVSVTAQLLRLAKENGAFLGPVAGVHINSNSASTTVPTSQALSFEHDFNWSDGYYYVRVDMNRAAGTNHVATFYGAALECTGP